MPTFAAERENIPLLQNIMTADYYVIKLKRFEQGLTQSMLAEKARISLRTLSNAEKGKSISPTTNAKIRAALGLD